MTLLVVRHNCTRHLAGRQAKICADPACGYTTEAQWDDRACRRCGGTLLSKCPACRAPIPAPVPAVCPECGAAYRGR